MKALPLIAALAALALASCDKPAVAASKPAPTIEDRQAKLAALEGNADAKRREMDAEAERLAEEWATAKNKIRTAQGPNAIALAETEYRAADEAFEAFKVRRRAVEVEFDKRRAELMASGLTGER